MRTTKAQYRLTKLVEDIKDIKEDKPDITGTKFKYKPKPKKKRDWFWYTEAQVNELNDILDFIRDSVDIVKKEKLAPLEDRPRCRGQQPKSSFDLAKALLVQQLFQVSNRVAEGLVKMFRERIGIEEERITYKDIERSYSNQDVSNIIDEIILLTNEPIKDKETKFGIDGTGLPTSIKQNYSNDKDSKKISGYDMLTGMTGVEFKLFSGYGISGPGTESPWLIPLLKQTNDMFDMIELVCGDPAYLSRRNCSFIESIGAKPRIFPKKNTNIKADGSFAWKRMLLEFTNNPQEWLGDYHNRSITETVNSVLKCRFTRHLLKRRNDRRITEIGGRIAVYNIRMLGKAQYTHNISVRWTTD